jgi:N6-adenosine-specific RNA methylase IME4/ParB-like chromosome segregation protein Spo0J
MQPHAKTQPTTDEPKTELRDPRTLTPHPRRAIVPALGEDEYRSLRAHIQFQGLREPLHVDQEGLILDGHHRLRAALELGLRQVAVRIVGPLDPVEYMVTAAVEPRQLAPSQLAALAVDLDEYWQERGQALARSAANLRRGSSEVVQVPPRGKTRAFAAARFGVGERTIQDAATVKAADPLLFEQIKQGTRAARNAAQQVRKARRYEAIGEAPPLPTGPFDLIYADPPWQLGAPASPSAPEQHYPTMKVEEICALELPVADDAVLFLWAVSSRLGEALRVVERWGFACKTSFVWVKPSIGPGVWARNRHELLLVGRRGDWPPPEPEDRCDSVIEAPRGRHSQKPALASELIERMYPRAAKLELFARSARPGWARWGKEAPR